MQARIGHTRTLRILSTYKFRGPNGRMFSPLRAAFGNLRRCLCCCAIMLALPSILGAPAPKVEANAAVLSYERQKQGATCQSCDAMVGKFAQLQQESRCADNDALYDAMVRSDAAVRFAENAPDMGQFSHYAIMSVGCNRADDLVSFAPVSYTHLTLPTKA